VARFAVPAVAPGDYGVGLCNDPCTISGFQASLSGFLTVVETARERQLLQLESRLRSDIADLRRELKRSGKEIVGLETLVDLREQEAAWPKPKARRARRSR